MLVIRVAIFKINERKKSKKIFFRDFVFVLISKIERNSKNILSAEYRVVYTTIFSWIHIDLSAYIETFLFPEKRKKKK